MSLRKSQSWPTITALQADTDSICVCLWPTTDADLLSDALLIMQSFCRQHSNSGSGEGTFTMLNGKLFKAVSIFYSAGYLSLGRSSRSVCCRKSAFVIFKIIIEELNLQKPSLEMFSFHLQSQKQKNTLSSQCLF